WERRPLPRRPEGALRDFERRDGCVLFGSGYLANVGVIQALGIAGTTVFSDQLNHASIVDGCRVARAQVAVYRHCDPEHLAWTIGRADTSRGGLIVTDSVFSMDGDIAPLEALVELARRHGLRLVVDEAHATGALGPGGRGAIAEAGGGGAGGGGGGAPGEAPGAPGAVRGGRPARRAPRAPTRP